MFMMVFWVMIAVAFWIVVFAVATISFLALGYYYQSKLVGGLAWLGCVGAWVLYMILS